MDLHASHDQATDGTALVHVIFERESPDADTPHVEVVFELRFPTDFRITSPSQVLILRSSTRTDTREPIALSKEEFQAVVDVAVDHAAGMTRDW